MKIKNLILPFISIFLHLSLTLTSGCQFLTTSPKTSTTTIAGNTTSISTTHITNTRWPAVPRNRYPVSPMLWLWSNPPW